MLDYTLLVPLEWVILVVMFAMLVGWILHIRMTPVVPRVTVEMALEALEHKKKHMWQKTSESYRWHYDNLTGQGVEWYYHPHYGTITRYAEDRLVFTRAGYGGEVQLILLGMQVVVYRDPHGIRRPNPEQLSKLKEFGQAALVPKYTLQA